MTKQTRICDRCGEEIKSGNFWVSKITRFTIVRVFGFGPYDFSNSTIELCPTCGKLFENFMQGEESAG